MTLLDAQHVSKTFGKVLVLDDVSLVIEPGTVHALLGENGSGKSTLIKVLAGFHAPEAGATVTVAGTELSLGSPSESTSAGLRFVHQNLGVIDEMTVLENLRLTSDLQRGVLAPTGFTSDRDVRPLLDRIGVELDLNARVGDLEPIQRTAVAIARAIDDSHGQMRLLVLDEPTAAMSPTEVDGLFAIIGELRSSGASVLYISHRIDEILRLADTATVLRDGRVQGCFAATAVSRADLVARIVGSAAEEPMASVRVADEVAHATVCLDVNGVTGRHLRDVSFQVRRGEIVGFAGLDGSGRDELASALGGAIACQVDLRTATGTMSGRPSVAAARAAGVGLVLPNTDPGATVAEFTVRENLCLPNAASTSRRGLISDRTERKAAVRWLEELDIRPRETEKLLRELSGGNRQKVALAKVLQQDPSVLVLNDPTSGVDVGARRSIYDVIEQRAALGVGVVVCSSDIEDLVSICDRVSCLVSGVVVDELSGSELTEQAILNRIVSDGAELVPPVASWRSTA